MTLVLLDTHAFVWAVAAPNRLGVEAVELIETATNELMVSAATAWELSTKVRLGKFSEAEPIVANYEAIVKRLGAIDMPVTGAHALAAGALSWDHRDPFDRMLAAQAIRENAVLVSKDHAFRQLSGLSLRW